MEIKKAIIPAAGLGTRFLPLTKVLAKELLPLVDVPMLSYAVQEAGQSGIDQIIFVVSEAKESVLEYFKRKLKLESLLKKRGQKALLSRLKKNDESFKDIAFSSVAQQFPKGDGHAILQAKSKVGKAAFAVLFPDDVFFAKKPVLGQLNKVFKTSQKPVIGLKRIAKEKLGSYGAVKVNKIANRLYKIIDIVEKPKLEDAPLDNGTGLAICGRYLLPPETFSYLEKAPLNKKGETILANALSLMLEDGKLLYGCEIEGEWLECGKIQDWLRSHLFLCLKHPEYGPMLKEFLKKMK